MGPGTVHIEGGRVAGVERGRVPVAAGAGIDVGGLVVMPGVIDAHVHVNEPGRTEWEGFSSAGKAAAAGGVTMMVVMPLNCSPVATTPEAVLGEARAAQGACRVDFGLWGGLVPRNVGKLREVWESGVLGFKCFLVHSGIDEFPNSTRADLEAAMPVLRELGAVLLVHAEMPGVIDAARTESGLDADPRCYAKYLASRPPESETRAIEMMIELCRRHGGAVHIVHVAAGEAIGALRAARKGGLPITAETCPHYLALAAEEIGDGETVCKCAPPIRGRADGERLWVALREGDLDLVASDHSPCPAGMKRFDSGSFAEAWGGISSLQLTLPVVWTHARRRGFSMVDVVKWLSVGPARLAGVDGFKGRIAPGFDADLAVFDPDALWRVRAKELHHRHAVTPYDGAGLSGSVCATMVRGDWAFVAPGFDAVVASDEWARGRDASGFASEVCGQWIKRQGKEPRSRS